MNCRKCLAKTTHLEHQSQNVNLMGMYWNRPNCLSVANRFSSFKSLSVPPLLSPTVQESTLSL
jgi:hypothetical protein